MEATQVIDPNNVVQLSLPTEMSEKLREAFNVLAHETTVEEAVPSAPHTIEIAPDDRPTVPRAPLSESGLFDEITADMALAPNASIPIALHRRKPPQDDSAATSMAPAPTRDLAAELLVDPSADLEAAARRHRRVVIAVFVALLLFAVAAGVALAFSR
jgi:hypothetical protein